MPQGTRPARVGEELRQALAELLAREVHDPGIGFVTITHVKVSADLQTARVSYTSLGDDKARRETARALGRATSFLRRAVGQRLRLRRVPELMFHFDESVENQARIERILIDLADERNSRAGSTPASAEGSRAETDPTPPSVPPTPPIKERS
jgi:ribosome-binding factor A